MKFLFCIKSVSTLGGGAERVLSEVANGLHKRGHSVSILTFEASSSISFYPLDPAIERHGFTFRGLRPSALIALRKCICDLTPDIVVGFMPSSYVPVAFALAGSGFPVIASEHNVPARYSGVPHKWMMLRASFPFVTRFTAVSEQMKEQYPRSIRSKMDVVPNPSSLMSAERADVIGLDTGRMLLAVGRLHPQKDHITLVRAFASIATYFPEWTLKILGDGPERANIEAEIALLGLSDRVLLPGSTPRISSEYSGAQLYVISSLYESYGLATEEALAHGLPAIGFADCAGTNKLIRNRENGVLVDPGSSRVSALADGLRMLMKDSDLRVQLSKSNKTSRENATIDQVLDQWELISVRSSGHPKFA